MNKNHAEIAEYTEETIKGYSLRSLRTLRENKGDIADIPYLINPNNLLAGRQVPHPNSDTLRNFASPRLCG